MDDKLLKYMLELPLDGESAADGDDELRAASDAFGELVASLSPVAPRPELRAQLFAAIDETCRFEDFVDPIAKLVHLSMERTRDYLRKIDEPQQWDAGPFPGVALLHIDSGPGLEQAITGFVRLDAGAQFPEHEHLGEERIFVLQGTYIDSLGETYGPGSYVVKPPGTAHHLDVPSGGSDCIYLAVVERGVQVGEMEILYDSPLL